MKRGILFFLNMGTITRGAKIAILPAVFLVFLAKGFLMMGLSIAFAFLCICVAAIPAPSDDVAMFAIKSFYESFEERIQAKSGKKHNFEYIKGYQVKGKMFLKRRVKNKMVYPIPMVASIVSMCEDEELYLMIGRMSLLKNERPVFEEAKISDCDISVENDTEENSMIILIKTSKTQEGISFVVENNYMSREFLSVVNENKK